MKKGLVVFITFFAVAFCGSPRSNSPAAVPETYTPILFVHGISSNGGAFNQLYEKFAAQNFPKDYLFNALLPRIGTGGPNINYAWYAFALSATGYDKEQWKLSGNSAYNVPALQQQIDQILSTTGKTKIDLVSHSNGTAVVRELLARYPAYALKVRKCVFISGFPKVSGANLNNTVTRYLNEAEIAQTLPSGIQYYNLTSPADDNITSVETYTGSNRLFDITEVPGSVNFEVANHDHGMVTSSEQAFEKIYGWLTEKSLIAPSTVSLVNIGGRIIYYSQIYEQKPKAGVKVKVNYYDPATGIVTGSSLTEVVTDSQGIWKISGVESSSSKLIYLTITRADGAAKNVYFFADQVKNTNLFLNFAEPDPIPVETTANGQILFNVLTYAEYLSRLGNTGGKPANKLDASIEATGVTKVDISGGTALPNSAPNGIKTFVSLTNYLISTVESGGNIYNFSPGSAGSYADKTVTLTLSLYQGTTARPPVKVQINGNDAYVNQIRNHLFYLKIYPE